MITPLLDTLLHNVLGRRADLDRVATRQPDLPLGAVTYTPGVRHGTSDTPDETLERQPKNQLKNSATETEVSLKPSGQEQQRTALDNKGIPFKATGSATTHLSAEGQTISRILEKFPSGAPVVASSEVLFESEHLPDVVQLASTLVRQVRHSGLFYESHLKQWLLGQYKVQELLQEPQNKLSVHLLLSDKQQQQLQAGHTTGPAMEQTDRLMRHQDGNDNSASGTAHLATENEQELLHGILRHQLELMAQPLFRWEGFLWPQVPVQWAIEQEAEQSSDGGEEKPRIWRSRLNMVLPQLGHVDLEISLQGRQVHVSGRVEPSRIVWVTLQESHLRRGLEAVGLELSSLSLVPRASVAEGMEPL